MFIHESENKSENVHSSGSDVIVVPDPQTARKTSTRMTCALQAERPNVTGPNVCSMIDSRKMPSDCDGGMAKKDSWSVNEHVIAEFSDIPSNMKHGWKYMVKLITMDARKRAVNVDARLMALFNVMKNKKLRSI